jgi:hypothetical protein
MQLIAAWTLNITTVSEANSSEHWSKKDKRHDLQQQFVKLSFERHAGGKVVLPCKIRLTRLGMRFLDRHDNLRMSLKWVVDQLADCISPGKAKGRADDDPRIEWEYAQEKHPISAVRIEIFL